MKYNRTTRRMFLQGAGNFLLAVPLLPSLLPREARAQAVMANKRFITIAGSLDLGHNANWIPSLTPNVYRNIPQPANSDNRGFRWQPLRDFVPNSSTPLARVYGTHLNNYLRSLSIMRGLDIGGYFGHGIAPKLGSTKRSAPHSGDSLGTRPASIDYVLSQNARINPTRRAPTTIGYKFGEGDGFTVNDPLGGSSGLDFTDYFDELYRNLFTNIAETGGGTSTTTTPAHPRRDILNRVMEDYNRTRSDRNISSVDRQVLTSAMDRFSDIFRRLPTGSTTTTITAGCSHSAFRSARGRITTSAYESAMNVPEDPVRARLLVDMLTAAIMCNVNNVFTVQLGVPFYRGVDGRPGFFRPRDLASIVIGPDEQNPINPIQPDEVTPQDSGYDFHQRVSHQPWLRTSTGEFHWMWMANHQRLIIERVVAPLIAALDSVVDPSNNQTYLYNSIIYTSWEHGTQHSNHSVPVILAGNAGGALSSGNYIDYSDRSYLPRLSNQYTDTDPNHERFLGNYQGASYNRLLVTILQAMGMQTSEYENRSLNQRWYNRSDIGSRNVNLSNIGGYGYFAPASYNQGGWDRDQELRELAGFDLRQFGNPLPVP